jgi:hypothetical protein
MGNFVIQDRLWGAITLGLLAVLVALQISRLSLERSLREAKQQTPNPVDPRNVIEQTEACETFIRERAGGNAVILERNDISGEYHIILD